MSLLTIIALIRLLPYGLATYIAFKKGYRWLTVTGFYVIGLAILNTAEPSLSPQTRALLSSFVAVFLLMHALNIPPKGGEK